MTLSAKDTEKDKGEKHLILYADDDIDDLELVCEAFEQYSDNVEIRTFRDGGQILSYIEQMGDRNPKPCLIILDINMPVINGKDVLKKLRTIKRFDEVPAVLFTTSSMPVDKEFAEKHKAGFITKPLNAKQMERISDQFIEHCTDEIRKNLKKNI
ncbi:MAG: response regulator [Flaviaesturariibacter sp.]|nr:response regulator [Flaviaesturariibacter sp.]